MQENKVIAVDLGGTNLRTAYLEKGKIQRYLKLKTPETKKELIECLFDSIDCLIRVYPGVKKIGIASPGPLLNGVILNPPNLPLRNFNLEKALKIKFKNFKVKIKVENDANCVALAEAKLGCKKSNFIVLTLGTGIGGGIIINNQIYKGAGLAGELGHIILDDQKDFETLGAWKATKKLTKKYFKKELKTKDLFSIKDKNSKKILFEISNYLGQGIGSLINVFDPEIVVLAGGVSETGDKFIKLIKKETYKYVILPKKTPIVWSKLKDPGIIGASLL